MCDFSLHRLYCTVLYCTIPKTRMGSYLGLGMKMKCDKDRREFELDVMYCTESGRICDKDNGGKREKGG